MQRSFFLCACGQVFAGRAIGGHKTKGACAKNYRRITKKEYQKILADRTSPARTGGAELPARMKAVMPKPKTDIRQDADEIVALQNYLNELKDAYDQAKRKYEDFKAGLQKLVEEA